MDKIRVYPSRREATSVSAPLSILDATVARFSATGAIWLFDNPAEQKGSSFSIGEKDLLDRLQSSFVTTLNDFPHWAGQVHWAPVRPGGSHTERFNRPMVTYGTATDPGVEWGVVRHRLLSVKALAPSAEERASSSGVWRGDQFDQKPLLSETLLPLHNLRDCDGLPAMQVQINLFSDGGYGIGIKMAHVLADAQSLMVFVHNWAANSRKTFNVGDHVSPFAGPPIFDPAQLDACAAGDIDAPVPDPSLLEEARQLPLHRFNWWGIDDPGYSPFLIPTTENSIPPIDGIQSRVSASTPAPWTTWDLSKPVSYALLHFPGSMVAELKQEASAEGGPNISRLDALLAHVWAMINRSRGHNHSSDDVFLNLTLGARPRLSLPESFIGSPLFITHIRMSGTSACLGNTASQIRNTLQLFTPEKMGAMLHDAAHEVSPQRLWQAFVGTQHTLVTSWLRLQVYKVDFVGSGQRPRYVHAVMPKIDGCVQVMDPGVDDGGIDVALYLDTEAMQRLLLDKPLHVSSHCIGDIITPNR
ncbi:transferase family protein [Aspergillus undulatus]|uniref:transferase family protein n=1 Tax=Aspergillus undulatus TaxID=1810928 RepID=UPI003CCC9A95